MFSFGEHHSSSSIISEAICRSLLDGFGCFDDITGLSYTGRLYRDVERPSIFSSRGLHREITMRASKQNRGSNEVRCGIIRGLNGFRWQLGYVIQIRLCEMSKILSEVSMKAFGGYGLAAIVLAAGISTIALMAPANRSVTFAQTNSGTGEKGEAVPLPK